jgi:branched-chain amino acid transport system substrate-binding protein
MLMRLFRAFLLWIGCLRFVLDLMGQAPIPAPANPWAAANLNVLDKDTNGMFLGANPVYIRAIQTTFPDIRTAADLVGRNDFDFYPKDLATQFRADDARVIAGGLPLEQVEDNQPIGGVRTRVHVTKIPLRNDEGTIVGLRAIWYVQPLLDVRRDPSGIAVSFPAGLDPFHLESGPGLASSLWEVVPVTNAPVAGTVTTRLVTTDVARLFRLETRETVTIGALLSLTGEWSTLGRNCQTVISMALESANLAERSSGSPLVFEADVRDTRLVPTNALQQLKELAARGVRVVIGPQSSSEAAALRDFADQNGILLVSPSSTAGSLAIPDDNLFRFCPDDSKEVEAMVAMMKEDGVGAVVPAWRDDVGNQGLHDAMERLFPSAVQRPGHRYAAGTSDFTAAVADLSSQVAAAKVSHPDTTVIYLAAFDEAADLFRAAASDAVLSTVRWYGSDGVALSEVLRGDPGAARFGEERGFPCPIYGLDDRYRSVWQPVANRLKGIWGAEADAFTLAAYDAVQIAVGAYRKVGASPGFADFRTVFLDETKTYAGGTGPVVLNAAGDRASGAFDFWSLRVVDGQGVWRRSAAYQPGAGGTGTIVRFP